MTAKFRHRRSGYLYVAVLMTTLLVSALVASALALTTSRMRIAIQDQQYRQARQLTHDELQRQLAMSAADPDWLVSFSNDSFSAFGSPNWNADTDDQVRIRFEDADGDLHDSLRDSLVATVHAKVGDSESAIQATLEPILDPHECLRYGVSCTMSLSMQNDAVLSSQVPVQAGQGVSGSNDTELVAPSVRCSGSISGEVRGDQDSASAALPTKDLVTMYADGAIAIAAGDLLVNGNQLRLEERVLTETYNPFGTAGPIYEISVPNKTFVIEDCRIEATIVVTAATKVIIREACIWGPSTVSNVLLVTDVPVEINDWHAVLDEDSVNANFNPSGAPWLGQSDNAENDHYQSSLRGLIATTENFTVVDRIDPNPVKLAGSILCKNLIVQTDVSVSKMDELFLTPPEGLESLRSMSVQPGSLHRVASP